MQMTITNKKWTMQRRFQKAGRERECKNQQIKNKITEMDPNNIVPFTHYTL